LVSVFDAPARGAPRELGLFRSEFISWGRAFRLGLIGSTDFSLWISIWSWLARAAWAPERKPTDWSLCYRPAMSKN